MTNEELEKKMEFIVEQQAQFTVDIQHLRQAQAQTDRVVNRLAVATFQGFKDINAKMDALIDSHRRLSEAQARTEESLRNLIAVVDRYFSKRNQGNSEDKN